MSVPILPSELQEGIPDLNGPACQELDKLLVLSPKMLAAIIRWFAEDFFDDLCSLDCDDVSESASTTTDATSSTTTSGGPPELVVTFVCQDSIGACAPNRYQMTSAYAVGGTIVSITPAIGSCHNPNTTVEVTAEILGTDEVLYEVTIEEELGDCAGATTTTTSTTTTAGTLPECSPMSGDCIHEVGINCTDTGDDLQDVSINCENGPFTAEYWQCSTEDNTGFDAFDETCDNGSGFYLILGETYIVTYKLFGDPTVRQQAFVAGCGEQTVIIP